MPIYEEKVNGRSVRLTAQRLNGFSHRDVETIIGMILTAHRIESVEEFIGGPKARLFFTGGERLSLRTVENQWLPPPGIGAVSAHKQRGHTKRAREVGDGITVS